jgi:hypothetical protein
MGIKRNHCFREVSIFKAWMDGVDAKIRRDRVIRRGPGIVQSRTMTHRRESVKNRAAGGTGRNRQVMAGWGGLSKSVEAGSA